MAANRAALETRIAGLLVDDDTESIAEIVPAIQRAQREAENRYQFLRMRSSFSKVTVVGTFDIGDPPALFLSPNGRPSRSVGGLLEDRDDVKLPLLDWVEQGDDISRLYPNATTNVTARAAPKAVYFDPNAGAGSQLQVRPVPDAVYTITIYDYERLLLLDTTAKTNWFVTDGEDFMVFAATAFVFQFREDWDQNARYLAFALSAFNELRNQDKKARRRASHRGEVTPRRDVHAKSTQVRM